MENKKITIYELIGLIKDEKAPKKVFYNDSEYIFCKDIGDYRKLGWEHCLIIKDIFEFDNKFHNSLYNMLNDTVEILPEENDEWENIEETKLVDDSIEFYDTRTERHFMNTNKKDRDIYITKINQLIKNQKYLKEKLDKYDREN